MTSDCEFTYWHLPSLMAIPAEVAAALCAQGLAVFLGSIADAQAAAERMNQGGE